MLHKILQTSDDYTLFAARVVLGFVMFAHGAQKALGWFGGNGFEPTIQSFGQHLGIPAPLAVAAILAEFLGGMALIPGLAARLGAFAIGVNMLVAVSLVHAHNGLFMNWTGGKPGEGFEYHLLALALAFLIVIRGAGAWSLDALLLRRLSNPRVVQVAPSYQH